MKRLVNSNEAEQAEVIESKITEPEQVETPVKKSNTGTIILVVVLIIILIGLFMYWNYTQKKKQNG